MNDIPSGSKTSPYRLYARMIPVVGVAALVSSFVESDQRGLMFLSSESAFFAEDAALAVPNGGATIYLASGGNGLGGLRQRAITSSRGTLTGMPSMTGVPDLSDSPGAGASRLIEVPESLSDNQVGIAARAPQVQGATGRSQPSPGPGFPDSPIGLIAVNTSNPGPVTGDPDNPSPVVPAVPEPASWLLMILGVGWLGFSLRRRNVPIVSHSRVVPAV